MKISPSLTKPHPLTPTPTPLPNLVLSCLSGHSDPIFLKSFDDTLWYSCVPQMPNLIKISLDIESDFRNGFFSTLHTDLKVESNFYDQSCTKMDLMLPPGPAIHDGALKWRKLCSEALKHGQGSHISMFFLWLLFISRVFPQRWFPTPCYIISQPPE